MAEKNKNIIIFILIVIVTLLALAIAWVLLVSKDENKNLVSCENYSGTDKCLYYNKNGFKIVKEDDNYYINGNSIGRMYFFKIKEVINNKYIIVEGGSYEENNSLYDINGKRIEFPEPEKVGNTIIDFDNNIITITAKRTIDEREEYICTTRSIDTIIYIKQEVSLKDNNFNNPKTTESKNLKQYAKEKYNKECDITYDEETRKATINLLNNNCMSGLSTYDDARDDHTIIIKGIKFNNKNYTFKYETVYLSEEPYEKVNYYLNDKLFTSEEGGGLLLSNICYYDNHLIISRGWEGYPYIDIYDADGNNKLSFIGDFSYNNNLLYIKEHSYVGGNFYNFTHYAIDLKANTFNKNYIKTEKIECDEAGYNC